MKPERFDRRITLRRFSVTYDSHNQPTEAWTDVDTVWASWRRASANEQLASMQVGAMVTDIFEIRWSSTVEDINPKDRLTYAGREYDISEVTEIGRRDGLLIRATARADRA
jgi:SPP1 family predicted phage head-tail adaptor